MRLFSKDYFFKELFYTKTTNNQKQRIRVRCVHLINMSIEYNVCLSLILLLPLFLFCFEWNRFMFNSEGVI